MKCSAMQFHDFVMVNNEKSGIDTKFIIESGLGYDRGAMIKGGLIVGHASISPPGFETRFAVVNFVLIFHCIHNWDNVSLLRRIFSKLQDAFYRFRKFELFFEI